MDSHWVRWVNVVVSVLFVGIIIYAFFQAIIRSPK
uniref:Uncharacterized protein n=1 Tax=viral metagenome TaxID=1070528 RepID=A0A6C0AJ96_9ZZZZ